MATGPATSRLSSCFITYLPEDQHFVDKLAADLRELGLHCWLRRLECSHPSTDGPIMTAMDRLLLVLSRHSIGQRRSMRDVLESVLERRALGRTPQLFQVCLDDDSAEFLSEQLAPKVVFFEDYDHIAYSSSFCLLTHLLDAELVPVT